MRSLLLMVVFGQVGCAMVAAPPDPAGPHTGSLSITAHYPGEPSSEDRHYGPFPAGWEITPAFFSATNGCHIALPVGAPVTCQFPISATELAPVRVGLVAERGNGVVALGSGEIPGDPPIELGGLHANASWIAEWTY